MRIKPFMVRSLLCILPGIAVLCLAWNLSVGSFSTSFYVNAQSDQDIIPKGSREISISVSAAEDGDYDAAFNLAKSVGMQKIGLSFDWRDIEVRPSVYDNPNLKIANGYYPSRDVKLNLTLRPIHANRKSVPDDLAQADFDDPRMISRFKELLDYVFSQTGAIDYSTIVIGSEFDNYLRQHSHPMSPTELRLLNAPEDKRQPEDLPQDEGSTMWEEYIIFCRSTAQYIKSRKPDVKVAFEATYGGLVGPNRDILKELNQYSDVVGVSYYPLGTDFEVKSPLTVIKDFEALSALYPDREISFFQLGYPSSTILNSSEAKQGEFIRIVFKTWDTHAERIRMINFSFLYDWPKDSISDQSEYFGLTSERFGEFLLTLGLRRRRNSGEDKPAFVALRQEAAARGW
ncbi:MAG: hypothetical protein JW793_02430 [Acidobacteria bacterium]|nr:hypothetical protein [Acidobacteriota bacterium]